MISKSALAEPLSAERPGNNWLLALSLNDPCSVLAGGVPWAHRGPLYCFFQGLLFDRVILARLADRPDCSDAELVLQAYERGGEAALSRLRGSFVVAIIDRMRDVAIIARDPLGSHPLFYVENNSSVHFAAAQQPLLKQPGVSRALNRAALADHLCHRWPDPHETFFAAVRRVLPGWRAIISRGRLRLERYWDPAPEDQPIQWLAHSETARFDEVFDRAVDRCLHHGPAGIFLSGGLDSISIAAVATDRTRRTGRNPPRALSLGFPDPACDERILQAAVARDLGIQQHLIGLEEAVGRSSLLEQTVGLNERSGAPILNPWAPAYLELARRGKRSGADVILTGQGGDEWLTVTPFLSADLIRRGAIRDLARFLATLQRSYQLGSFDLARNMLWRSGLRPLAGLWRHRIMPATHKAIRLNGLVTGDPYWIAPDQTLRAEQICRAEAALVPSDPPQGFYLRELRRGMDHTLTSWEMEEQHELGQRIGVRFLYPYCDPDLVELLYRTPPQALNEGGRSKGLVRGTLARRFPDLGFERQRKVLATSFFESLLRREGPALVQAAGDFPALSTLGVVDGQATRAFADDALKQPGARLNRIWDVLILEAWARSNGG